MKVIFFFLLFSKSINFFWLPTANNTRYWFSPGKKNIFTELPKVLSANQLSVHLKEDGEILASVMALHKEDGIPSYTL